LEKLLNEKSFFLSQKLGLKRREHLYEHIALERGFQAD
jgi:hypothetical protein